MREIKFRGIDCSGQWVYGDLIHKRHDKESVLIQDYTGLGSDVDTITIGQYTGLKDKNGKEIYEGDIVKKKEIGGYRMVYIGIVRYYDKDCRFGIDTTTTNKFTKRLLFTDGECSFNDGHCTITYTDEYEIIGNIYDNPKLIKEEEK